MSVNINNFSNDNIKLQSETDSSSSQNVTLCGKTNICSDKRADTNGKILVPLYTASHRHICLYASSYPR